jgi:hypothetical protein
VRRIVPLKRHSRTLAQATVRQLGGGTASCRQIARTVLEGISRWRGTVREDHAPRCARWCVDRLHARPRSRGW